MSTRWHDAHPDQEKTVTWHSARKHQRPVACSLPPHRCRSCLGRSALPPMRRTPTPTSCRKRVARQSQLKKTIETAAARSSRRLNSLQRDITKDIAATKSELKSINADLVVVKKRITRMKAKIEEVKAAYDDAGRTRRGARRGADPAHDRGDPRRPPARAIRRTILAVRIRSAYDTRPDVAARDVPVRRLVHRHPRRGELHDRRGRAGQGARPADRT